MIDIDKFLPVFRWYGTPLYCDKYILPIEIENKIKVI